MNTLRTPSSPDTRAAFTLMELLAVMLLILTVLGMGVPAMFAAERKSYVNQAMQSLIELHNQCQKLQRELAARGDPGVITLTIDNASSKPEVNVAVVEPAPYPTPNADVMFGRKFPISINADEFISAVDFSTGGAPTATGTTWTWKYEKQTGFIDKPTYITLTFKALPSGGTNYKVKRDLHLYPQGYSEVP